MRVLILGGGGREHALAWKLRQSERLEALFCAPGNPGIEALASCVPLSAEDPTAVVELVRRERIDLVVVGPEAPLVAGVSDAVRAAGVACFGPDAAAAALEGSKAFAKEIMAEAGVPTAAFRTFTDPLAAEAWAREQGRIVVKVDGLAAGKGVIVALSPEEGAEAVRSLAAIGAGNQKLVLEEVLEGEEVSVIALCDGERYVLLPPAQDHKRVGEGDTGPNTGGMGAVCPVPFVSAATLEEIGRSVIRPVLKTLAHRGAPFRGALYAGLMMTESGPRVLEFNARFGDPETQVLVEVLDEDLLLLLDACARGTLEERPLRSSGAAVGVVLAAAGYPASPRKGDRLEGLDSVPADVQVFHAGTAREEGGLVTSGGRVLTVCARRESIGEALEAALQVAGSIRAPGLHFRRDIGRRALSRGGDAT